VSKSAYSLSATGIVFFALGLISSVGQDGAANAGLVLAVAAELGLAETACRAAILRLRRDRQLVSERVGRSARYAASPAVAAAQRRWAEHFQHGPPAWDGTFSGLLYDFPERDRARRDRLRRLARLTGYGLLRPGVLISPDDRWPELAETFGADMRAGRVLRVGLTLCAQDERRVARELWDLDRLANQYRQIVRDTDRELARSATSQAARRSPIQRLYATTQPIYEAVTDDPALPSRLLPEDWPGRQLGVALTAANTALGPAALARLNALGADP
jgi:phenylacetic acid degradation operon negative regulatory protein